jgi:hypothetical protein
MIIGRCRTVCHTAYLPLTEVLIDFWGTRPDAEDAVQNTVDGTHELLGVALEFQKLCQRRHLFSYLLR